MIALTSRWDWYEATIDGVDDGRVSAALALSMGGTVSVGKARNGYAHCDVVERDGEVLAEVYGHSARAGEVHVTVTSNACDKVVPWLRERYPEHRVSRADAACDFTADFDAIDVHVLAFAQDRGISFRLVTNSEGGATRYLGSPTSETRLRVYKKSEQLRALHPEASASIPDGIIRCELVIRPGKRELKERVSHMSPDDVWGLSGWSAGFAEMVLGLTPERVPTHFRRPTNWSRVLHVLSIQYGPSIGRRAEQVGRKAVLDELAEALGLS
jgi:hypothetical protein